MARGADGRSPAHATSVKILVTGPAGCGKTTLISVISAGEVVSTERVVTHAGSAVGRTTVAMDVGRLPVDRDLALTLFGTPGAARFAFMRPILAGGALGLVLLVDAAGEDRWVEAADILHRVLAETPVPYVVAVNRCDETTDLAAVRQRLDLAASVPVLAVDARDRDSVKGVLLALLHAVLADAEALEPVGS